MASGDYILLLSFYALELETNLPSAFLAQQKTGSGRCLETRRSLLHCAGMESLISLICGNAQMLYGKMGLLMAAFHNLSRTNRTQSSVMLPTGFQQPAA